jgi:hypothetical protein
MVGVTGSIPVAPTMTDSGAGKNFLVRSCPVVQGYDMRKPAPRVVLLAATLLPLLALAEPTHVGVPGSQIVNLVGVLQESPFCGLPSQRILVRVRGTGAPEDKPFVVPSGMRLIITDVSWIAARAPSSAFVAGSIVQVAMRAHNVDGSFEGSIYTSSGVPVAADTTDLITGADHLATGAVVAHERQICVQASAWRQTAESLPNSLEIFEHTPLSVHVSGYLARF